MSAPAENSSQPSDAEALHRLQASIDQSNLRRAAQLSMAEKFRMGADLYDEGMVWLKQIIKAEQPELSDKEVDEELDRRRAIKRRVEEAGIIMPCDEGQRID